MESNDKDLYQECDDIVDNILNNYASYSNDEKMRKLYIEVGKLLSKSPVFFYERDPQKQKEIYDNYKIIKNREVVCKSVVFLFCDLAKKLDLKCRPIECDDIENINFNHWALVYENENKKYLINPIPDFYRVQMNSSTKSFCHTEDYKFYQDEKFDSMSDEYLRQIDKSIGYLKNDCYTDELFEKLSEEMQSSLGTFIVRTSNYYQKYYLKLLDLIKNDNLSIEEKMAEVEKMDTNYDKNKPIIEDTFQKKIISSKMKRAIHGGAYKSLRNTDSDMNKSRYGADFVGSMDVTNLKEMKRDIMLYKFNYLMKCIPKYTTNLTGYIENKNFIDELSKMIFKSPVEKECIHRHTVVQEKDDGTKNYYLMFAIKDPEEDNSYYCFYDHNSKTFEMPLEPISFMMKHKMSPLKDSSLNEKIANEYKTSALAVNTHFILDSVGVKK